MPSAATFRGRVLSPQVLAGQEAASIELHAGAIRARTAQGQEFVLPYGDCHLEADGGGAIVCRTTDRSLAIGCDDPRFLSALEQDSGGALSGQARGLPRKPPPHQAPARPAWVRY